MIYPNPTPSNTTLYPSGELQQGGGSGLGLVLTKGIVEQHGGCISVFSAGINTGCTFTILLPMFKPGNEKLEAMNREDASTANRRIFMNRYLEGLDQNRSGDLDLVPHGGGTFILPNSTSPRPTVQLPGNASSMKILPVGSSTQDTHGDMDLNQSDRSNASVGMSRLPVKNISLNLPLLTSGKGLVGQIGSFVMGGGSRQNTSRGEATGRGDTTGRGDKSPNKHINLSHTDLSHVHDEQVAMELGGMEGGSGTTMPKRLSPPGLNNEGNNHPRRVVLPISNKEVGGDEIGVISPKRMESSRLEPIVPKTGLSGDVTPTSMPSTLKEHLLTLEKLRILIVDDSAMNRKMLTKVCIAMV